MLAKSAETFRSGLASHRGFSIACLTAIVLLNACGSGNDNHPLAIAVVGPLSGSAAARGKDMERAVRMAVDESNAAGGINGKLLQLTVYDDGDQPDRASELARQIAGTPALAVLGQVASSAAKAAGAVYKEESIPAVTGAASESEVTKNNPWYFRLLRDAEGQGRFLADYGRYQLQSREIAVLREKRNGGRRIRLGFSR